MNKRNSIQLKATFLLVVFAMNTIVGFACSLGINLGFKTSHHHDEEETTTLKVYIHTDGKKHVHHEVVEKHDYNIGHHHHEEADKDKSNDDKDNCCHDKVIKLDQLDKSPAKTLNYNQLIFFTTFVSVFYYD